MNEKQTMKFGDICREVKLTTRDPVADGYEFYLGLEHLDSSSLKIRRWGVIEDDNPSFTRVFKKGHILFGKRRPYLKKAAIAEFDGICSGDIIVIEEIPENEMSKLLHFIMHSNGFWNWAIKTSSGSLSPRTKFKEIAKYEIRFDSGSSINNVLNILQNVEFAHGLAVDVSDSGSNAFDTIITNMMTFGIESNKGVIKTKYLNHNLSWCVKPLSGLVRKVKRGPSLATNERGKGVRYLTSGNIQDNKVDMISEVKHLDGFDAMDQCRICPEDILFNCVNSMARVGKVAYVTSDSLDSETIVGFNNYSLEVDKEVILPKFLYYFMVDKRFLHRVRALVKPAINQASFASKELNHMLIAYPSINEQKKIVGLLDEASSLLDHEKIQIEKIAAVRTNLSQSLGI